MGSVVKWCCVPICLVGKLLIMSDIVLKSMNLKFTQSRIVWIGWLDASFILWCLLTIADERDLYPVIVSWF